MNSRLIRKGIIIILLVVSVFIPAQQSFAVKQEKAVKYLKPEIGMNKEVQLGNTASSKVFVRIEGEYLPILNAGVKTADPVGKAYPNTTVEILEQGGDWTKIVSGNVVGYVEEKNLIIGKEAVKRAKEILEQVYPKVSVLSLTVTQIEEAFSVAESKQEEEARLAAEEALRIAKEQERIAKEQETKLEKGKAVVSYAKRFLGNPYVYGGTSLTKGTDCSGFVKSVYAHFGVSLPRTSYEMRRVGYKVSYSEIQPGDIVCYRGHVGIYAGDGKIVNAIDESRGIGMSNARARSVITVRRIF